MQKWTTAQNALITSGDEKGGQSFPSTEIALYAPCTRPGIFQSCGILPPTLVGFLPRLPTLHCALDLASRTVRRRGSALLGGWTRLKDIARLLSGQGETMDLHPAGGLAAVGDEGYLQARFVSRVERAWPGTPRCRVRRMTCATTDVVRALLRQQSHHVHYRRQSAIDTAVYRCTARVEERGSTAYCPSGTAAAFEAAMVKLRRDQANPAARRGEGATASFPTF